MGQLESGMQTMNQSLLSLYQRGLITLKDAMERSPNLEEFRQMVAGRSAEERRAARR